MPRRALVSLLVLVLCGGCAARQRGHEKTLRECSTSGDAGRHRERRGTVDGTGGLSTLGDQSRNQVTEIRDDCVYTVKVRAGDRGWEVDGLSWVGSYAASKRGDRVAFVAQDREGWHVIVDGERGPAFDGTSAAATFSADGVHVMFVGFTEGRSGRVFVDGKEVARAPFGIDNGAYGFTSDGRYLVGIRTEDGGVQVSAGGVLGPRLDTRFTGPGIVASTTYLDLATSLSGGRFAYVGTRGDRGVLVVDGHEVAVPEGTHPARPLFSATGARLLYTALPVTKPGEEKPPPPAVVIDGVVHPMPGLSSAVFTRGEIPLVITTLPLGLTGRVSRTHLFGVDRLDQKKPPGEPDDRLIFDDHVLDPQDIDVRADGTVTCRGAPFAQVRGRHAPARAE